MKYLMLLYVLTVLISSCADEAQVPLEKHSKLTNHAAKETPPSWVAGENPENNDKNPIVVPRTKEICLRSFLRIPRPCTEEEKEMIHGINRIIKEIKNFDPASLNKNFFTLKVEKEGSEPSVTIFGEHHLALIGQIQTLAAINWMAKKGDVLLLEGKDRHSPKLNSCELMLLLRTYAFGQYAKDLRQTSEIYDPSKVQKYLDKYVSLFESTFFSYDLSNLRLDGLQCYFWDLDRKSKKISQMSFRKQVKERNASMRDAIKEWTHGDHRVFILTGLNHMPFGESISFGGINHQQTNLAKFYQAAKSLKNRLKNVGIDYSNLNWGTSKVLWEYLQNIAHSQFIHNRMIINPLEDP